MVSVLFLLSSCVPPATAVAGSVITISAEDLYADYVKDQATADAKYRGRTLEVTGEVIVSRAVIFVDKYYIILNGNTKDTSNQWGIQCAFNNTLDEKVNAVEKHEVATIKGRGDGMEEDVVLGDCELIKVVPKPGG